MAVKAIDPEIQQLWIDFKQDQSDEQLRNRLIVQYYQLVKYNAERVWAKLPEGVDLNDLISAGVFGLMDAIEDQDDVQHVWANFDVEEKEIEASLA